MKRKLRLVVSVFAAVGLVLGLIGCDDGSDTTPVSYTHSIQYSDWYQIDENETALSILQSADGQRILGVQEIGDEPVVFTDVPDDRVTVTTVKAYVRAIGDFTQKETELTTYVNVPVGSWHYGGKALSQLGSVQISVSYPEDLYEYLYIASQAQNGSVISAEQMMWFQSSTVGITENVNGIVNDRTISAVAILGRSSSGGSYYAGVLKDQPFLPFSDNQYSIELTNDFTQSVTTASPSGSVIQRRAFYLNGKKRESYIVDNRVPGSVENSVVYPSALENELCRVDAHLSGYHTSIWTKQFFQGLPDNITVPDGEVNFMYDSATNIVTDITTNTDSKVVHGSWQWYDEATSASFDWTVYTSVDDRAMQLPQLPDSLYTMLGFDDEDFLLGYVSAESYNTVSSYEDYINKYFDPADPDWIEYDTYSSFARFTGLGWANTEDPSPAGIRNK